MAIGTGPPARIASLLLGTAVTLLAVAAIAGPGEATAWWTRAAFVLLGVGALAMAWQARHRPPTAAAPPRRDPWLPSVQASNDGVSLVDAAMQLVKAPALPAAADGLTDRPVETPRERRTGLPWIALALTSFVAALFVSSTPALHPVRPRPSAELAVAQLTTAPTPDPAAEPLARPVPVRSALQLARADVTPLARPSKPLAGRQVLRCVAQGRVTYTDADGHCDDGDGERITVFPTQGVGSRPVPFR